MSKKIRNRIDITRNLARDFSASADQSEREGPGELVHPTLHEAMIDSYRIKAQELELEAQWLEHQLMLHTIWQWTLAGLVALAGTAILLLLFS